jgi:hypothetical protein
MAAIMDNSTLWPSGAAVCIDGDCTFSLQELNKRVHHSVDVEKARCFLFSTENCAENCTLEWRCVVVTRAFAGLEALLFMRHIRCHVPLLGLKLCHSCDIYDVACLCWA